MKFNFVCARKKTIATNANALSVPCMKSKTKRATAPDTGTDRTNSMAAEEAVDLSTAAPEVPEHEAQTAGAKLMHQASCRPTKSLGRQITYNQPDVEVLAVAFRAVPLTLAKFDEMREKKDFVLTQFGILDVGPAGFSSAPYKSTKKKTDGAVPTLPLYEKRDDSAHPYFFPFEKGPTPKDRGPRVESDESGQLAAVIKPGVSITHFLYNENDRFNAHKFFVDCGEHEMVPEHSLVYLQLGCNNIEQARKGRLIKIKKIKPALDFADYSMFLPSAIASLPASAEDAMATVESCGIKYPSIKEILGQGSSAAVFAAKPVADASAAVSDDDTRIEIPEYAGQGSRALTIPAAVALDGCATYCIHRACKIIGIAVAAGALTVVSRPASVQRGPDAPDDAIAVTINHDLMFNFQRTSEFRLRQGTDGRWSMFWALPDVVLETDAGPRYVVYSTELVKREGRQEQSCKNQKTAGIVADGCAGQHHPLRIYVCDKPLTGDFADFWRTANPVCTLNLQLRPGNFGSGKKRKRLAFEEDDDSSDAA